MIQGNIKNYTFTENLFSCLDIDSEKPLSVEDIVNIDTNKNFVMKIIIPNSLDLKFSLMRMLRTMNISDATLFPGIDGFSRSLKFIQEYSEHSIVGGLMDLKKQKQIIKSNRFSQRNRNK